MFSKNNPDFILGLHIVLGLFVIESRNLIFFFALIVFFYGLARTILNKNADGTAHLFAAYFVGLEIFLRMAGAELPHEFVKYAVSVLLIAGLHTSPWILPLPIIIYGLLQVPAIFMTDGGSTEYTRQLISANFSGPVCLIIATIYFYKRRVLLSDLRSLFLALLYPLVITLVYLFLKSPSIDEVRFTLNSNFETSGGFGPNQVSSILGMGILIIGFCVVTGIPLFKFGMLSVVLITLLSFRGLLTFSRGGMLTPLVLLAVIFLYISFRSLGSKRRFINIVSIAVVFIGIVYLSFNYVDDLTGSQLLQRYQGGKKVSVSTVDIERLTSGRSLIYKFDLQIFQEHPIFGVGLGMGQFYRVYRGNEISSHIEFTRLLAEHGLAGIFALFILLVFPLIHFYQSGVLFNRLLMIACVGFCFFFMSHSATRITAPCFLYGLAFINAIPFLHKGLPNLDKRKATSFHSLDAVR